MQYCLVNLLVSFGALLLCYYCLFSSLLRAFGGWRHGTHAGALL